MRAREWKATDVELIAKQKQEIEKLELEIEDLKRRLTETEKAYESWKSHDLLLQSKYNATLKEMEYFCINIIESYDMKYHVHVNTFEKAIEWLKNRNTLTCPKCDSTNIEYLAAFMKECNNCKYCADKSEFIKNRNKE